METIVLVIHVLLAVGLIGLVLIQHGKGADAGASFGSGASATVFGARGSGSFLARATTILALLFFCTSIGLYYLASKRDNSYDSVLKNTSQVIETEVKSEEDVLQVNEPTEADKAEEQAQDLPKVEQ